MSDHVSKIARLIQRDVDVDEHIQNIPTLRSMFLKLKYPPRLIESAINNFIRTRDQARPPEEAQQDKPIRIVLPFKDQRSADALRRNLNDLNKN